MRTSSSSGKSRLRVVLVTAFPPSRNGLNEYGYHLARTLEKESEVDLYILADRDGDQQGKLPSLSRSHLLRVWRYNSWLTPLRILFQVARIRPHVVWFNLVFSTFGDKPIPGFLGLLLPWLCKVFGFRTAVTLHHLFEFMDLSYTTLRDKSWLGRIGCELATRILISADAVYVTLERYASHLRRKYNINNVQKVPHGYFYSEMDIKSTLEGHRILVFGKFGSYKRLDNVFRIFTRVRMAIPQAELWICGQSHPSTPGYFEEMEKKYGSLPGVIFKGYIPEQEVPKVISSTDVVLLPYLSTTGIPSVAMLACSFGVPIIAPDLPELVAGFQEEGGHLITYPPNDEKAAINAIIQLFRDRERMKRLAEQNRRMAKKIPMDEVSKLYKEKLRALG